MLTELRLSNFRCYPSLRWEIPAEGALLVGNNAQGKTSLMEAMCMVLTLHSPRCTKMQPLAAHGSTGFGISADTDTGTRRICWQEKKLSLQLDGAPCPDFSTYLADTQSVVWLSNSDISLVTGSAEERRRYLDFLGVQWHPHYRVALHTYRRALRSRNLLLRNPRHTPAALQSYAEILARHGELLMLLRSQLLQLLRPHITQLHARISGREEPVEIIYTPSTEKPLSQAIAEATPADEKNGATSVGPHRDDFSLLLNGRAVAAYASEGQQRTLSTALLLAQSGLLREETGMPPILFIDDIFGELDPDRRNALLSCFPPDGQTFITTTHLSWADGSGLSLPVQRIENGRVLQ